MTFLTRLALNVPVFLGGIAGILFVRGYILLGWGAFICGALAQNSLYNPERD